VPTFLLFSANRMPLCPKPLKRKKRPRTHRLSNAQSRQLLASLASLLLCRMGLSYPEQQHGFSFGATAALSDYPCKGKRSQARGTNWQHKTHPCYLSTRLHLRDLGRVQVICIVCDHTGLLPAEFLIRLGLSHHAKLLDLTRRMRCRECGERGRALISVRWTAA